ncbi:MAG TPA: hypothetical protein VIP52_13845 [Candidatus Dormibacteraeota bacterium]
MALVRLPSLFEPRWYSDEGIFTTVAWAAGHGRALYSGVYDNAPPMIYWLFRLAQALGSLEQHSVVQLLATVAATVAAVLTFEVSRRFLRPSAAALAGGLTGVVLSLPVLDGDLINVELAALPFFLGALLLAFSRRGVLLLVSGALLGITIATRPSFVLDSFAIAVPLLAAPERVRRLCLFAAGVALACVAVVAVLAGGGSLAAYLAEVLPADHAYLVWSNGGTLFPLLVRLGALTVAALIGLRLATTPAGRLAAVWLPAALAAASLTPRELTHYSHEAIPPISFAVALAVGRIRPRWLAAAPAALAVIVAAEAVLILPAQETAFLNGTIAPRPYLHNFSYRALPAYYWNWLELVLGRETAAAYADRFPGSPAVDNSEAAFLRSQPGSADARLIVLGDRPWLYIKTGMLPGSRYVATNSAFWRIPSAPGEMTSALGNACARFVVDETGSPDWLPGLDSGGYVRLPGAPLPTYRSERAVGDCG